MPDETKDETQTKVVPAAGQTLTGRPALDKFARELPRDFAELMSLIDEEFLAQHEKILGKAWHAFEDAAKKRGLPEGVIKNAKARLGKVWGGLAQAIGGMTEFEAVLEDASKAQKAKEQAK